MGSRALRLACLTATLLFVVSRAAMLCAAEEGPPYAGRRLADVLGELQERGLSIIYSSAVVRPEMVVRIEPRAEVRGRFGIGDAVDCVGPRGEVLARGLVAYGADEIRRIAGQPTRKIPQVLGYSNGHEVIHRDNLVILHDAPGEPR